MAYFDLFIHFGLIASALFGMFSIRKMLHPSKTWFKFSQYIHYGLIGLFIGILLWNFFGVLFITVMGIFVYDTAWIEKVIHGVRMDFSNIVTITTVMLLSIFACGLKRIQDGELHFHVDSSLGIKLTECTCTRDEGDDSEEDKLDATVEPENIQANDEPEPINTEKKEQ